MPIYTAICDCHYMCCYKQFEENEARARRVKTKYKPEPWWDVADELDVSSTANVSAVTVSLDKCASTAMLDRACLEGGVTGGVLL